MFNPGTHNFTVYQGSTLRKRFQWTANGVPMNLTGYTGRCQFRSSIGSPTVALEMTTLNGGVIIEPLLGTITLHAPATATSLLKSSDYVYDLEVIDSIGDVSRVLQGHIAVNKEVTR